MRIILNPKPLPIVLRARCDAMPKLAYPVHGHTVGRSVVDVQVVSAIGPPGKSLHRSNQMQFVFNSTHLVFNSSSL